MKSKTVLITQTGKLLSPFGPIEPYGEFGIVGYIAKADVSGGASPPSAERTSLWTASP